MKKLSVGIIDTLGLPYDGSTLAKRGLGGSESAVILMSKELARIGFTVHVFNDCNTDDTKPGIYNQVEYHPLVDIANFDYFDILIAMRSIVAFVSKEHYHLYKTFSEIPNFEPVVSRSKHKILWMHDTFCDGDDLIEDLVIQGKINEIFTLSDFHTSYVTNCNHGKRRNFEVLKNHVFHTRNGIHKYIDFVDIGRKKPNLFVYNASYTKGMQPLVEKVWPKIKERIPDAKLKVIGGFYKFKSSHGPDEQEQKYNQLVKSSSNLNIRYTGIIKQEEIAQIMAEASYMIYPAGYPETFGISSLEALAYNTPLITCRFGALEETAIDLACYKIDYAIEPNGLFQWIDTDQQVDKFVDTVVQAYNNKYLHQQKMYACNQVKDICEWSTVALQWKQHFYNIFGMFMDVEEYREVTRINNRVRKVFGRRFSNKEEIIEPRHSIQQKINIITPVYNAEQYIGKCIDSVVQQDYDNYEMYIINDASTDDTLKAVGQKLGQLPTEIRQKIIVTHNMTNMGAVHNQITTIVENCEVDSITMLLDGDDWLVNDANIFHKYNNLYHAGAEFTYGSCWSVVDNIPLIAQPYPPDIKENRAYRRHMFNWKMPYTHLRTFRTGLITDVEENAFKDEDGKWLRAGGDTAVFYNLIEKANPNNVVCVSDVVYNYNDANPLNDYKVNSMEQNMTSDMVVKSQANPPHVVKDEYVDNIGPWMWSDNEDQSWDYISRDWFPLKNALLQYVDKWDVCIQAGGHQGMYPRLLLNHFKKVYTFEPDPTNFYYLKNNCWQEEIVKINAAIGAYERNVSLYRWHSNNTGCIVAKDDPDGNIPVVTLDSLNLEACDLIQLDVERYEMYALMGAIKTIEKFKPVIVCEGPETTNDVCTRILEQLGYEVVATVGSCNDTIYKYTARKPPKRTLPLDPLLHETISQSTHEKKKVLIAIPTAKYIESATFKAIYDLYVPEEYEVEFQTFYGYNVDQVRNLIASWVTRGFDYLFAVDHDITFEKNTLAKLLAADKPIVSGVYRQRLEPQTLEIYDMQMKNMSWEQLKDRGIVSIGGCGFGCVLVKKQVFESVEYPWFTYHSALDHKDTFSEDLDFCSKARQKGYTVWCDTSIICDHHGSKIFKVG